MYFLKTVSCRLILTTVFLIIFYFMGLSTLSAANLIPGEKQYSPSETVQVSIKTIEETYSAVGSVKPRSETMIESQVSAQVLKVLVQPGDRVKKGDLLITLDDRQAASRRDGATAALNAARAGREQAMQGVTAAEAAYKEARLNYERIRGYFKAQAATKQELENAESNFVQAQAALKRAKDAINASDAGIRQAMGVLSETHVGLEFSKIAAPADGEVIKRMVEPGDLALPGKPLISIRTETGFRIEAYVREGLINRIRPGMVLKSEIATLHRTFDTVVEEIIPYADPETRTFLVKAALKYTDIEGGNTIYPGMYGKLLIPESEASVILIPSKAVITTGQLELVMVKSAEDVNTEKLLEAPTGKSMWQLRYIKTGKHFGEMTEVLSGLRGDETIGIGGVD